MVEMGDWQVKILLAFVLGAVVGLEREINERKEVVGDTSKKSAVLGLRSFSIISGLGALCGLLYFHFPIVSAITVASVFVLMIAYYILDSQFTKDIGMTTELAIIFTFVIGFLLAAGIIPIQLLIALTVILVLLMSRKENIKEFVEDISRNEINALVSFGMLTFVILPFLPNQAYALVDFGNTKEFFQNIGISSNQFLTTPLFNPFVIWLIVVLITGVDLLGYVLERSLGSKSGFFLTSLIGGIVSSTATTISIAQESKNSRESTQLVSGAIFSTLVSFLPLAFLLVTLNLSLFVFFIPVLITLVFTTFAVGVYFLYSSKNEEINLDEKKITEKHKIFDLVAALRFVGIFLMISLASKFALLFFGNAGFLTATGLGALSGLDAVVVSTASLAGSTIGLKIGIWALVLANSANLIAKAIYSFMEGSREFAYKYLVSILIIIGTSVLAASMF